VDATGLGGPRHGCEERCRPWQSAAEHLLYDTLNPEPVSTKIDSGFELPALRVMAVGSFEPTFHQSESRRRVVCMPLCEEAW